MIVGFTGHRPEKLGGYSAQANYRLVQVALEYLTPIVAEVEWGVNGLAQGWDQACAQACVCLGIPWTAAVPFVGQEAKWPAEARARYRKLLGQASGVEVVSQGGYAASKLLKRNRWMVDRSHRMLACWDGLRGLGGTAACIAYAEAKGVPIVNLYGQWKQSP